MIKKFVLAAALMLAAVSTANAGVLSPDNVNTNANQNTQGQLQGQGQAQGQFQGQILNNANEAWSSSKSSSVALSGSAAAAKASADNDNEVTNTIGGDSINFDAATASSAVVLASSCSQGGSAQTKDLGVSFGAPSRVCEHVMLAESYMNAARILKGQAQVEYVNKAAEQLEAAGLFVERTSPTALVARVTNDVGLPIILFIAAKAFGI